MKHAFQIGRRIGRIERHRRTNLADGKFVKRWKDGKRGLQRVMHGSIKLDENVCRVVQLVGSQFADGAQVEGYGVRWAIGALISPAHDPLVAALALYSVIKSIANDDAAACRVASAIDGFVRWRASTKGSNDGTVLLSPSFPGTTTDV